MTNGNDFCNGTLNQVVVDVNGTRMIDTLPNMPLTKREWFVAATINGILAHPNTPGDVSFASVAVRAVGMADAIIAALNQENK